MIEETYPSVFEDGTVQIGKGVDKGTVKTTIYIDARKAQSVLILAPNGTRLATLNILSLGANTYNIDLIPKYHTYVRVWQKAEKILGRLFPGGKTLVSLEIRATVASIASTGSIE